MKSGQPRRPEPQPKPGIIVGDEVYCHHPSGPHAGRVKAHGKHGVTLESGRRVRWEHVLGHKRRAGQEYTVVDEGEDGCIVQDKNGLKQFIAVPPEAREENLVIKAGGQPRIALLLKADGTPYMGRAGLTKKVITDKNAVQTTRWVSLGDAASNQRNREQLSGGAHVAFDDGSKKGVGRVWAHGADGALVVDSKGNKHQVRHEHMTHVAATSWDDENINSHPDEQKSNSGLTPSENSPRAGSEVESKRKMRNGNTEVTSALTLGGKRVGFIETEESATEVAVRVVKIEDDAARGKGVGISAYKQAIEAAHESGKTFTSDKEVSKDALAVYDRLKSMGYKVEKSPNIFTDDYGRIHSKDKQPVFRIRPPESIAPARPSYAPRQAGETDKAYAKRAVDTGDNVHDLPEDHGRYFNTEGSTTVPLDKLHSTKTDEENQQGGDNGPKRMLAAYHGDLGKRLPITVMPHATKEGHHEVVDGNGTLTSAKRLGWKTLPVNVVSREQGESMIAADKAKEAAQTAAAAAPAGKQFFDPQEVEALPSSKTWRHDVFKSWDEAEAKGPESLEQYTKILGDLAGSLGFKQGPSGGPARMTDEHLENGDSYLFMGPLKKKEKASKKVATDYAGDWGKLKDYIRATIAVRSVDDVHKAIGALKASGLKLAQAPKDNMTTGTADGYRDINMILLLPNGMPAELQIQVKQITKAKSAAHGLYNDNVALELKNKDAGHKDIRDWPPGDRQKFAANRSRQREIYGDAWAKVPGSTSYPDPATGRKEARDAAAGAGAPLQKSSKARIIIFGNGSPP